MLCHRYNDSFMIELVPHLSLYSNMPKLHVSIDRISVISFAFALETKASETLILRKWFFMTGSKSVAMTRSLSNSNFFCTKAVKRFLQAIIIVVSLLVMTIAYSLIILLITEFTCFYHWNCKNTTLCSEGYLYCSRFKVVLWIDVNKSIFCFKKISEIEWTFRIASFCFSRSISSFSISKTLNKQ